MKSRAFQNKEASTWGGGEGHLLWEYSPPRVCLPCVKHPQNFDILNCVCPMMILIKYHPKNGKNFFIKESKETSLYFEMHKMFMEARGVSFFWNAAPFMDDGISAWWWDNVLPLRIHWKNSAGVLHVRVGLVSVFFFKFKTFNITKQNTKGNSCLPQAKSVKYWVQPCSPDTENVLSTYKEPKVSTTEAYKS
jgi:hypothetical protein